MNKEYTEGEAPTDLTRESNHCARAIVQLVEAGTGKTLSMSDCSKIVQCVGTAIEHERAADKARIEALTARVGWAETLLRLAHGVLSRTGAPSLSVKRDRTETMDSIESFLTPRPEGVDSKEVV